MLFVVVGAATDHHRVAVAENGVVDKQIRVHPSKIQSIRSIDRSISIMAAYSSFKHTAAAAGWGTGGGGTWRDAWPAASASACNGPPSVERCRHAAPPFAPTGGGGAPGGVARRHVDPEFGVGRSFLIEKKQTRAVTQTQMITNTRTVWSVRVGHLADPAGPPLNELPKKKPAQIELSWRRLPGSDAKALYTRHPGPNFDRVESIPYAPRLIQETSGWAWSIVLIRSISIWLGGFKMHFDLASCRRIASPRSSASHHFGEISR